MLVYQVGSPVCVPISRLQLGFSMERRPLTETQMEDLLK